MAAERAARYGDALILDAERRAYVEEVGRFFEESGLPRMAGRLVGCLLVARRPLVSSVELAAALEASKGSISTMTRLLGQLGLIERHSRIGERADSFRLRRDLAAHLARQQVERFAVVHKLAARGAQLAQDADPEQQQLLAELRDLYAGVIGEFRALVERWETRRTA